MMAWRFLEQRPLRIFFDVDGVLIDGWQDGPGDGNQWDAALERDFGIDRRAFQRRFFKTPSGPAGSPMQACALGQRDLKEALAETLPGLGYHGSVEAFVAYWFEKDSKVNYSVLGIARHLARHDHLELYLATNQEHHRAAHLWHGLGFEAHFKEIFYSAKLGHLKPRPGFFAAVDASVGIAPDESPLFFDDRRDNVEGARAAGWDACLYEGPENLTAHPRLQAFLGDYQDGAPTAENT